MENTLVILISFAVTFLFIIGVPIFLVIGFWVIGVSLVIDFTLANIGVTLYEGLNFYGLLALPLFILTGDLIKGAGIAKRLSDFAYSCLGWLRGGLAMASLGACGLFAAMLLWGLSIARSSKDSFGAMLAVGIVGVLFWPAVINVAMVLGLAPVIGVPLPFLSYGGSALLASMIGIGLLLNVSMRRYMF